MSDRRRGFVDTNVFVYSFDPRDSTKQTRAQDLIQRLLGTGTGVVSWQVVQEFLNVATGKFERPLSLADCSRYLRTVFVSMCEVFPTIDLYAQALGIRAEAGIHYYDALVVAAAIEARCSVLYTADLQDGREIRGLTIVNPFAHP